MMICVSNCLKIKNPTPALREWVVANLILDNPDYYKKERMGLWTGNIPKKIWLYENKGTDLWLPFGCMNEIWRIHPIANDWRIDISPIRKATYRSDIDLRKYQSRVIEEAIKAKNGVIVMPCGSGKTQTALEIVSRIGGRALWLTHTQDLLNQSMDRAKFTLECPSPHPFGRITDGKVDIGTHITFATVQTFAKKIDLDKYKNEWDVVICDECQHAAGSPTRVTQFYKALSRLSARYKFGLTATPKRADGLEQAMFALLGGICAEVTREEVKEYICDIKVENIETGYVPNYNAVLMADGTIDYARVVDDLVDNPERTELVAAKINECIKNGPTLILANRVRYLTALQEKCEGRSICLSGRGTSKKAKAERKEALRKLNDGELDCVFASYQLAAEGLDCPNLRYIVFATPEKNDVTVTQAAGRAGRRADGKSYGTVIDFVDEFGMYKGWWKKRLSIYKKIGCDIIE